MYFVYILKSEKLNRFYAGITADIQDRMRRHGKDRNKFTGKADDWELVRVFEVEDRSEALKLESKIKKRGIRRFLEDLDKASE